MQNAITGSGRRMYGTVKARKAETAKVRWRDLTEDEVNKFKRKQCQYCYYFSETTKKDRVSAGVCNFSAIMGYSRFCSPLECKEKGFYEELNGRKRPKISNTITLG